MVHALIASTLIKYAILTEKVGKDYGMRQFFLNPDLEVRLECAGFPQLEYTSKMNNWWSCRDISLRMANELRDQGFIVRFGHYEKGPLTHVAIKVYDPTEKGWWLLDPTPFDQLYSEDDLIQTLRDFTWKKAQKVQSMPGHGSLLSLEPINGNYIASEVSIVPFGAMSISEDPGVTETKYLIEVGVSLGELTSYDNLETINFAVSVIDTDLIRDYRNEFNNREWISRPRLTFNQLIQRGALKLSIYDYKEMIRRIEEKSIGTKGRPSDPFEKMDKLSRKSKEHRLLIGHLQYNLDAIINIVMNLPTNILDKYGRETNMMTGEVIDLDPSIKKPNDII